MSPELRSLYARHLLLAEIGEVGQHALCASTVGRIEGDPRAAHVAHLYLERAGVRFSDAEGAPSSVATPNEVAALAGRPELAEAAAFLAGSLAAVEHVKAAVGAGSAASQPTLSLAGPEET